MHDHLDPDWERLRGALHRMSDEVVAGMRGARELAAWQRVPPEVAARLRAPFAAEGVGLTAALDAALADVVPYPTGNNHPRFWGWVMGSGVPAGVVGAMLASAINANNWGGDQGAAHVELAVIEWLRGLTGLPAGSSGLLLSGGSMANLAGLTIARNARLPVVREQGLIAFGKQPVVYASSETHSSVRKAVELLGLGTAGLRLIPVRDDFTIDLQALAAAIAADRAAGRAPFCVVGNASTVNTGAVDPLPALAALCAKEGLWFHVDAAIGGVAMVEPGYARLLAGIERADSVGLDMHKWLYMPYECAAVLCRHPEAQRASYAVTAPYLAKEGASAGGPFVFSEHGIQLSRGDRGLKVWLALRAHGTAPFAAAIAENLAQARHLTARVDAEPRLERLAPAPTNVVVFRFVGGAGGKRLDDAVLDDLNRRIVVALQERRIALPSFTTVRGRSAVRCAITNHRSTRADFDALVAAVLALGEELA
jgi:glutamate/tyrosine decarboxylase-like PLP-dependent enzyme